MGWEQGEHIAVVGDTGSGKTTLMSELLKPHRYRDFVVVLKTKRRDDTFENFRGYRQIESINQIRVSHDFYILAPPRGRGGAGLVRLREETIRLLDMADQAGGWTVVIDELFFVDEKLKLGEYLDDLLTQGRSSGLTLLCGMQRPVRITRFALSQATHVFAFEMEGRDAQELGYATSQTMRQAVNNLDGSRHEFAYFNRRQRKRVVIGRAQTLSRVLGE